MTPTQSKRRHHLAPITDDDPPPRPFWIGWAVLGVLGVVVFLIWRV